MVDILKMQIKMQEKGGDAPKETVETLALVRPLKQ